MGHGYSPYIALALATEGGHLAVGRGGATLFFGPGASVSSYDIEPIKNECVKAGLPVIDTRLVDFGTVARIAINGPFVAVGQPPDRPPYHALSRAPLAYVAESYVAAGAMVWNQAHIPGLGRSGE
ncbi:hypothetical protein [Acidocella facilis]|uniref:hypothetical protein n=1 Tax=Acidocella facilis TaxID=525 RepID=UPI001F39DA83|nr:hypothetical protein [Acidocella facilis]